MGAFIHIERTCNTKLATNYIDRKTWCKMTNQGNLGKITCPIYFVAHNRAKEMLVKIIKACKCPKHQVLLDPKPKLFLMLEVFTLHQA